MGAGVHANAGMPGIGASSMLNSLGSAFGPSGLPGMGSLSIGDIGAYGAAGGFDSSNMADVLGQAGFPGIDSAELAELLSEAGRNPQGLQQRMRDEFRHMTPDEQNRMLDALASTGMASRAWWEQFLRGL